MRAGILVLQGERLPLHLKYPIKMNECKHGQGHGGIGMHGPQQARR